MLSFLRIIAATLFVLQSSFSFAGSVSLLGAGKAGASGPNVAALFATTLYTGTGSGQTVTSGIANDLVWVKSRSAATDNILSDTTRGVSAGHLISNTTAAQSGSASLITAIASTGFTVAGSAGVGTNAATYVGWSFAKAARFFDVVTFTGNGSARTIAHSLGVTPGMVIVKRTDTTSDWYVYHNGLTSASYYTLLDTTVAQTSDSTIWNATAPTSSVFSVGTGATNTNAGTYVAYLFAHDTASDGVIQCGSFTTDGGGNATVTLGWEPQYLLLKTPSAVGSWFILDQARGWASGNDSYLRANLSAAELTDDNYGQPSSTGFTVTGRSASTAYIYMAIRKP